MAFHCAICALNYSSADELLTFCNGGCMLCKHCSTNNDIRDVILDDSISICLICEVAGVLQGRNTIDVFDRCCKLAFNLKSGAAVAVNTKKKVDKKKKAATSSTVELADPGELVVRANNSDSISIQDWEAKMAKKNSIVWKSEEQKEEEQKKVEVKPKKTTGSSLDVGVYIFPWSGGSVDTRCVDLDELFGKHPVRAVRVKPAYRSGKLSPLMKYFKLVKQENGRKPTFRRTTLRNLFAEINELYEQWLLNSDKVSLAEFLIQFTSKQYGMKKFVDQHLCSIVEAILQYAPGSRRVQTFGVAIGVLDQDVYSPMYSVVLHQFLELLFETRAVMREILDAGEGQGWIREDLGNDVIKLMFAPTRVVWLLQCMHAECERRRVPLPWNASVKSTFIGNVSRLAIPIVKGMNVGSRLRGCTRALDVDSFIEFSLAAWQEEYTRTRAHMERIENEQIETEDREIARREETIRLARKRPYTAQEVQCLRGMIDQTRESLGLEEMPTDPEAEAWVKVMELNTKKKMIYFSTTTCNTSTTIPPFLVNRPVETIAKSWFLLEKQRIKRERIYWDFFRWEWDEDWEWGGIRVKREEAPVPVEEKKQEKQGKKKSVLYVPGVKTIRFDATKRKETVEWTEQLRRSVIARENNNNQKQSSGYEAKIVLGKLPPLDKESTASRRRSLSGKCIIDLRYYGGGEEGAKSLVAQLEELHEPIETLSLRENFLSDESCSAVVKAIHAHHHVVNFDVSKNRPHLKFVDVLEDKVCVLAKLRVLNLSGNKLNNSCAKRIIELFHDHTHLEHLNLSDNCLGDSPELAKSLKLLMCLGFCPLKHLDLSWNRFTGSDGVGICYGFSTSKYLETLKLEFNRLDDALAPDLSKALSSNETLLELDVGYNSFSKHCIDSLLKGLGSLSKFVLRGNSIGEAGVSLLSKRFGGVVVY